jgi:hypothetical protein
MFAIASTPQQARMCMMRAWMEPGRLADHSFPGTLNPYTIMDIQQKAAKSKAENEAEAKKKNQDVFFYDYGEFSMQAKLDGLFAGGSNPVRKFRVMEDVIRYGLIEQVGSTTIFTMGHYVPQEPPMRVRLSDAL